MALSFLGILGRGTLGRTLPSFDNFVRDRTLIHRRLIVARRNAGETNMFVITLVPSSDARGNIGKSLENFHYLGSGD